MVKPFCPQTMITYPLSQPGDCSQRKWRISRSRINRAYILHKWTQRIELGHFSDMLSTVEEHLLPTTGPTSRVSQDNEYWIIILSARTFCNGQNEYGKQHSCRNFLKTGFHTNYHQRIESAKIKYYVRSGRGGTYRLNEQNEPSDG